MMQNHLFTYQHLVQFYETDLMGIVHHTNYLRFCEEARVSWAHHHGLVDYQKPESASQFAVLETKLKHLAPVFFGDQVRISLQARRQGAKLIFQYLLHVNEKLVAEAETVHISMGKNLKPQKLPHQLDEILEKEKWIETLLLNL